MATEQLNGKHETSPLGAVDFIALAGSIASDARSMRLKVPGFSTPPKSSVALRTIRRLDDGEAVVSVAIRGRSRDDVRADLVDGVIATNRLSDSNAEQVRQTLHRSSGSDPLFSDPPHAA